MYDQVSVFEVLAADDQEHRTASRKALALAKVRVDDNLGRFLRAAQSEEEFEERLALVLDDFTHIVANSSAEVGHEHPEHIAAALRDHYHATCKIADKVNFEKTDAEEDEGEDDEEDNKPPWLKAQSSRWAPYLGKRFTQEERDAFSDRVSAAPKARKAYGPPDNDPMQQYPPANEWEDRDYEQESERAQAEAEMAAENAWQQQGFHGADEVPPGHPDNLDYQGYDPEGGQPCPHGPHWRHCPHCNPQGGGQGGGYPSMDFRSINDPGYQASTNPSDQDDHSSRLVTCPECGGDGKTAGAKDCGKCKGKGKVPNFGDSMLDTLSHWHVVADGTTGLGGPEPTMDKSKWTPTNPTKYNEDSTAHPNIEKDIIEPIKAVNDDALKEIGEKTTEHESLPSETENSGFQSGGEDSGPHTDTWHGSDGQANPVTSKADDAYSNPLRELLGQDGPSDAVIDAAFAKLI